MTRPRLTITLAYRDEGHPSVLGSGPGWYLTVPDPQADNHIWLAGPHQVSTSAVREIATTVDQHLGTSLLAAVDQQSAQIVSELEAKVAQRQRVLAEIDAAEAELARLRDEQESQ